MSKVLTIGDIERLREIKEQLVLLLDEANKLVRGTSEEARAKAYWYGHARMSLDDDHMFLGNNSCTLEQTIETLAEEVSEEIENEVDEDRLGHGLDREPTHT